MNPKVKVAMLSVGSNTILVILKLVVGLYIGSVSVMSEAIHSGLDLVAAGIALFSVRQSSLPPDETHQFGHGKIENVSGVIEALLIFGAAIWIIIEAVDRILHGGRVEAVGWGMAVMGFSAAVNWGVSTMLYRTAIATDSVALEADALHLRTDVYTSVGVVAGLVLLHLTGIHLLDPLAALVVAVLIIHASYDLTKQAFFPLIDTSLPSDEEQVIREVLSEFSDRFVEFHQLRTRKAGAQRHIDLHLVVQRDEAVEEAHAMCDQIEKAIEKRLARSSVLIHVEPCNETCEKCNPKLNDHANTVRRPCTEERKVMADRRERV